MDDITGGSSTVLCVDDDRQLVELIATSLERQRESFTVVTETGAAPALDTLEEEPIDCIVSDYDMPEIDGLEFLERVRERDPDLPFILFTGKGSEVIASEAISAGVTDYLQKQLGTNQFVVLANRIHNGIEHYRTQRRLRRNESLFEALFHDPAALVWVLDTDGTLLEANRTALELADATRNDVEGSPVVKLPWWNGSDQQREDVMAAVERAADGTSVDLEALRVGPAGESVTVGGTVKPVTGDDDVVAVVVDCRLLE